jgi:hypothetical protein
MIYVDDSFHLEYDALYLVRRYQRLRTKVLPPSPHSLTIYQNTLKHIAQKLRYLEKQIWIVTIHKRPMHTVLLWIIFCLLWTLLKVLFDQNYKGTNTCPRDFFLCFVHFVRCHIIIWWLGYSRNKSPEKSMYWRC